MSMPWPFKAREVESPEEIPGENEDEGSDRNIRQIDEESLGELMELSDE